VTAAALAGASRGGSGLREVNPRRDMEGIATLLETAFAGELDPYGVHMVREMRAFGRAGWLGWLVGRLFLPPAAYPLGFVWLEQGRVVGNASLLPVSGFAQRWVMANVAVDPDHRRRGIARALVKSSLDLARARGGLEVVLQVRRGNQGAEALYTGMRFEVLTTRTTWSRSAGGRLPRIEPPISVSVRRRATGEWPQQWDLARRFYPEGLLWPFPADASLFRPKPLEGFLNMDGRSHWVSVEAGQVVGSISSYIDSSRAGWRAVLMVRPEQRGTAESPLVAAALQSANAGGLAVSLDYEAEVAEEVFLAQGFRAEHTLRWMRLALD